MSVGKALISDLRRTVTFIRVRSLRQFAEAYARDLSKGGIFIRTPYPPRIASPATMILTVGPDNERVEMKGFVVGRALGKGRDWESGMQVELVRLDDRARGFLSRVIRTFNEAHPKETLDFPEDLSDVHRPTERMGDETL